MKYSQTKPIVQESLNINVSEPEKIIIPSEMTRCGVLYVRSDMPSFQQTGVPALVVTEKKYGPKENPRIQNIYSMHFPGRYLDDYMNTEVYCPECGRQLVENGTLSCSLRHLPIGGTYTNLDIERRRLRCLNVKCRYNYTCPIDF